MKSLDNEKDLQIRREYKIVKANEIVQKARYDLTLQELKILAFVFSMIKPTDKVGQCYTLSIKDFCKVCGIAPSGKNYDDVKRLAKQLRDKSFYLMDENGDETTVGWLSKVRCSRRNGNVTVEFDRDMERYVHDLIGNYTQYSLLSTLPMKSRYSFRLFEILHSYAYQHSHEFDIDDLKRQICAEVYVNFKDFRKKVLEIATKEINEYTDLSVTWEPVKKGRKVVAVRFFIEQLDSWGQYYANARATKALEKDQIKGQMNLAEFL